MFLLLCVVIAVQATFGVILSSPRDLEVNYKRTHEEYDVSQGRHLPIVEVFKSDLSIKLPLFSWKLYDETDSNSYNTSQQHYEIELYHEYEQSTKRQLIWKSDKILSNKHFCNLNNIHYAEDNSLKNILSEFKWEILSYRVRSTYNNGLYTEWSKFGRFVITSSVHADWNNASYIAQNTKTAFNDGAPMFTKTFSLSSGKTVSSAVVSLVGLGFFRLYVNNNDILNLQKPPIYQIGGWTNTKYRVPYATFDIASYLSSSNELKVYLGEGYRNQSAYAPKDGSRSKNDPIDCILKLQLVVKYSDNTQDIIITDSSWKTASTKIRLSSIYNGETYDQTANTNNVQNVIIVVGPSGILSPTLQPFVSINKIINPLNTIYPYTPHKSQIVDFGENNGGVVRINVGGLGLKKGDRINMKFAEIKQHPPYGAMDGSLYYGNLRSAQQYDTFISDGNSTGFYTPYFTMHGFRFMEVWGYPRTLKVEDVQKLQIYADVAQRSNWTSADKLLNTVNDNCLNGQRSNLKSVPTDCNQRDERLGWMGDAGLSSNTFAINFDMKSFLINYLELMTDEQGTDGSLPDVVPFYRYGGRPSDPNWGIAYPQNINVLYQYYGTSMIDIIKQYMDGPTYNLPNYVKDLQSRMPKKNGKDDIAHYPASYGDWVPPPPNPKISNNFAGAFGYIETVRIIKNLAKIIGNTSYESYLNTLQTTLRNEFIAAFYSNNKFLTGLQTSYAMTLHSEIYSSDTMKNSLETNLIKQINADHNLLTTGIIGAKFILPILHDINQTDLSLNLIKGNEGVNKQINASYPSWVFEQENYQEPATAIWELWNAEAEGPGMNSRNHHMYSSVSAYLNTDISGIKNKENLYNHWVISIGHLLYNELKWSIFQSDRGLIRFKWEWKNKNQLNVDIIIPVGHFGHLYFRINNKKKQCKMIQNDDNIQHKEWQLINHSIQNKQSFIHQYDAKLDDDGIMMIGSGHYKWSIFCLYSNYKWLDRVVINGHYKWSL